VIDDDGYRPNVGIVICNRQGQVMWARRFGQHSWQFPQGGINPGESAEQAMYRELFEEVSRHEVGMDVLTKLLNRRFLPTIFKREIAHANRTGTPLSVLIIDVDKFKEINDTWGHNTGDEILRKVSQAFYDNVRSSDYVFRYGGDEFIIVLTEASENETLRTAERIRSRVEKTKLKAANGEDIALSLSIGAAMFNGHPDYERLIQIADEALYIAKRRGRNRVELWKASL